MATPEERFADLLGALATHAGVTTPEEPGRRGFGSSALKVHGAIFAMLSRDRLVLKLPHDRVTALIAAGTGGPFDAGNGRPMRQWVTVSEEDRETDLALAREALEFVGRQASRR